VAIEPNANLAELPLFPLNAVLFPGGPLKLRIFEARYVDMIGRCMRADEEFGVAMIVEGKEVGPARTADIGTSARIFDFETLKDGLLGIAARGARRFKIHSVHTEQDGLNVARVEFLPVDPAATVAKQCVALSHIVASIFPHVKALYAEADPLLDDASWLSARAAELLPLSATDRQHCLELNHPAERLAFLMNCLEALGGIPTPR
jgi:Lon protease-like protein